MLNTVPYKEGKMDVVGMAVSYLWAKDSGKRSLLELDQVCPRAPGMEEIEKCD